MSQQTIQFSVTKTWSKVRLDPEFQRRFSLPFATTDEDYESLKMQSKHFKRYAFGIIGDTLTDFQKDIIEQVNLDRVEFSKLGLVAYVPELVARETKDNTLKKTIRTEYRDSVYIGDIGEPVEGVCKILDSYYSTHYERFAYTADYMGNLVSFWNKYEIPVGERRKFKAKVKKHSKNKLFSVNQTDLNYVRLYKVQS